MKKYNVSKRTTSIFIVVFMIALMIPFSMLSTAAALDDSSTTDGSRIEDESNFSDDLLGLEITFSGEGTVEDPYIIDSKETLCAMYLEPDAHYSLAQDIEFEDSDFAEGGICEGGWQPIQSFGGILNGNGYAISNLQGSNGGFIATNKGTVTSVRFLNAKLRYSNYGNFGVIANYNASAGLITQCYAEINSSAHVTSSYYAGGIVGFNAGTVSACSTEGSLEVYGAKSDYTWINGVGGIVGCNNGTVTRCYNRANIYVYNSSYITEYVYVGGIAGQGRVSDCRSECSIYVSVQLDYDIYYGEFTAGYQNYATNCYGTVNFSKAPWGNNRASIISTKMNCYTPNSFSVEKKWMESSYTNFDFTDTWMIKNGEPVPQGIMDADGICYTKVSFYDEIAEDGSHVGESQYANQYGEVITEVLPLTCTCDTTIWQYDDNVHYHTCSCGKKFNTAEHVRRSDDKDCEESACIYCGKAMPALASHTRNSAHKHCEDSTCIYCDMVMPALDSHTRNSEDANCVESACIYCDMAMPAIESHYVHCDQTFYRIDQNSFYFVNEAGEESLFDSLCPDQGWFVSQGYNAENTMTICSSEFVIVEFKYYTTGGYYDRLTISKNGTTLYTTSGNSSTVTKKVVLTPGDVVTFTYYIDSYDSSGKAYIQLLTPNYELSAEVPLTDIPCTNDNYGSGYHCNICYNTVMPDHKSNTSACEDGECVWCGAEMPSDVQDVHHVIENTLGYATANDRSYPFQKNSEGWYVSSNKAHNSTSVFTLTATKTMTLTVSYYTNSESGYDWLTICKNGIQLYVASGQWTVVSANVVSIDVVAGDVITFSYSKDSISSGGADEAYFKLSPQNQEPYTVKNDSSNPYSHNTDGWYVSSNTVKNSSSSFTLTAKQDMTLMIEYGILSTDSYDELIIYKNNGTMDRVWGSSYSSVGNTRILLLKLVAGDTVKITYSKKSSSTDKVGVAYFKFEAKVGTAITEMDVTCQDEFICEDCGLLILPDHVRNSSDKECEASECVYCGMEMAPISEHYVDESTVQTTVTTVRLENSSTDPFSISDGRYASSNKKSNSSSSVYIYTLYDCEITLKYGVSSENNFDWLTITKNGKRLDRISGLVSERTITISLSAGDCIEICYSKDGSGDYNSDEGYFEIISGTTAEIIVTERTPAASQSATCTNGVICIGCGCEVKPALDHEWDDGVITTEPTQTTAGVKTFTCPCGAMYTEPIYIEYDIVFKNYDGTILASGKYRYGDEVNAPEAPTKEADSTYTYTFAGWDKEVVDCAGDATYTATYNATYIDYTVIFKDEDGTILSTKTYHYGDEVIAPATPTKAADETYTYTFAGWDKEVVDCVGDATYTATYDFAYIDYTVIFKDEDGTILSTKTYHYGDEVIAPTTPTKAANETYTYTFAGWDNEVVACDGDKIYTATYTSVYIEYTVVFKDYDGSIISSAEYHYGQTVTKPSNPTRAADNTYTYAFAGWDKTVTNCTESIVYTAMYSSTYIDYTVIFMNEDRTVLSTKTYYYGDEVIAPATPTKAADETYTYTFAGWNNAVVECAGDATYTATYNATYIDYTVTFKNEDGGVISIETYHYGEAVVAPKTPTKAADETYTYTFAGWDNEVVACDGDKIYTATYTSVYIEYTVVFKDYDGSIISSTEYHYGQTVTKPSNPTRAADNTYTYAFVGWDKIVTNCTENIVYTATYSSTYIEYEVVFKNYDGSILSSKTYHYGDTIEEPTAPAKPADESYAYGFAGWDSEITACLGNKTYTATFNSTNIEYTVVFKDHNGNILTSETYHFGDEVVIPDIPTRSADNTYTYTFKDWGKTVTNCVGNVEYTAVYKATYIEYNIKFLDWNGTIIQTVKYHYGDTIMAIADPERESDETYTYTFLSWNKALGTCTGNASFTAQYEPTFITYTIVFKDHDGSVINRKTYHFGDTIVIPENPVRVSDDTYSYTFKNWGIISTFCNGNKEYTAVYNAEYIDYTVIFKDYDGSELSSRTYHFGDEIVIPNAPIRKADNTYTYAFAGWNKSVVDCAGDATYIATYNATKIGDTGTPGIDTELDTNPDTDIDNENDGLSSGAVAGIAAGSTVVAGAGGFSLFWFVIRKKHFSDLLKLFKKK